MKLSILFCNTNDGTFTLLKSNFLSIFFPATSCQRQKNPMDYFQCKIIIHKLFIDVLKKDQAHPE